MKKALARLKEVYCRLGVSGISGVGIFAVRPIPKGANPFPGAKNNWDKIPLACLEEMHPNIAKMVNDFGPKEGKYIWVPREGFNNLAMCYYINHCENPNMQEMDGGDYFIAIRDIAEGEELSVDYRTYDEEGHADNF